MTSWASWVCCDSWPGCLAWLAGLAGSLAWLAVLASSPGWQAGLAGCQAGLGWRQHIQLSICRLGWPSLSIWDTVSYTHLTLPTICSV